MILKAYFAAEDLVSEVFSAYMKSNYFTRTGRDQSSFDLNVQACRLVLDILPGLEVRWPESFDGSNVTLLLQISVLSETSGSISVLSQCYKWIFEEKEPLMSYAIGLLAVAMRLNDVATDEDNR